VRHTKLIVHQLHVDDDEVAVSLATLMAVRREATPALDWEVVAKTVGATEPRLTSNLLRLVVVSGADESGAPTLSELAGPAVVVRYVEDVVVWRGDGALLGFEDAWLR
jgi:hypothetical protein